MQNRLRLCLDMRKLLEQGECGLTKDLEEFVSLGVIRRKGRRVVLENREFVEQYFQKHCQDLCADYDNLVNLGYEPRTEKDLRDGLCLITHLKKFPNIKDVKLLSASLFGEAKRIEKSSFLSRILNTYCLEKQDLVLMRSFSHFVIKQDIDLYQLTASLGVVALCLDYVLPFIKSQNNIKVVISENLAPFLHMELSEGILLYTGGYSMVSSVICFLNYIRPSIIVHFGDVDRDGLKIYEKIATKVPGCRFYPDIQTLEKVFSKEEYRTHKIKYPYEDYQTEEIRELALFLNKIGGPTIEQETILHLYPEGIERFLNSLLT